MAHIEQNPVQNYFLADFKDSLIMANFTYCNKNRYVVPRGTERGTA